MQRNHIVLSSSLLACAFVAACSSAPAPVRAESTQLEAAMPATSATPVSTPAPQQRNAPEQAMLTAGMGVTNSPVSTLFTASYDIPIDDNITVGPAIHYGYDDDQDLLGAEAKARYFLSPFSATVQAYASAGAGLAMVDRPRRDADYGTVISGGAGLRVKTSTHGMLSSEVNWYYLPEDLAGEESYFGWQIVQFVMAF
jgi:hypothetical protein